MYAPKAAPRSLGRTTPAPYKLACRAPGKVFASNKRRTITLVLTYLPKVLPVAMEERACCQLLHCVTY